MRLRRSGSRLRRLRNTRKGPRVVCPLELVSEGSEVLALMEYIGWGMSLVAAVAIGLLIGSVRRKRKEEMLLQTAREEAEQLKREMLFEARQEVQEFREDAEERSKRREDRLSNERSEEGTIESPNEPDELSASHVPGIVILLEILGGLSILGGVILCIQVWGFAVASGSYTVPFTWLFSGLVSGIVFFACAAVLKYLYAIREYVKSICRRL